MRPAIAAMLIVIGGAALLAVALQFDDGPNGAEVARYRAERDGCRTIMGDMQGNGFLRSVRQVAPGEVEATVKEEVWLAQATRDRLVEALTVYCAMMPDDGRLRVTLLGADGAPVFRIKNGRVEKP